MEVTISELDFNDLELAFIKAIARENNLPVEQVFIDLTMQFIADQQKEPENGLVAQPSTKIGPKSTTLELPVACRRVVH